MAGDAEKATLAGLGEFAVIDRLVRNREQPPLVALGPGDDAAVVLAPDGRTVVSTDMLVEGRHFRLDWSSPRDVGRKAIAQNAADIEATACGRKPGNSGRGLSAAISSRPRSG
jgi:thiamine-monophosphate kinase